MKDQNRVIRIAQEFSETFVSVILYSIGIISAVPELMGTAAATGNWGLALAVATTGVGTVHVAILTGKRWLWYVFAAHMFVLEITLMLFGAWSKIGFPIFTAIGALTMVQFMEYTRQIKERRLEKEDDKAFSRAERREDNKVNRLIKMRKNGIPVDASLLTDDLASTVTNGVTSTVTPDASTSGDTPAMRQQKLLSMLQSLGTPDKINKTKIAAALGVSRQTVIRDISALQDSGMLSLNGTIQVGQGEEA